jgi:hypothetical protein
MKETYYIQPSDTNQNQSATIVPINTADTQPVKSGQEINQTNTNVSQRVTISTHQINPQQLDKVDSLTIKKDSVKPELTKKPEFINFTLYPAYRNIDSSEVFVKSGKLNSYLHSEHHEYSGPKNIFLSESGYKSWILIIALFCTFLLIVIRSNFQKYFQSVTSSLLNYQLAEKLMREKNVLIRRAFLILNLNYFLVIGLFLYLVVFKFDISFLGFSEFGKFFLLLMIFVVLLQIKLIVMQIIGYIFDSRTIFREYVHISYLINKNLGLYLLPVVFSTFFMNRPYSDILFYIALIMIAISLIIKYIRSAQIILKHKVFLFYSILYLCTFEILPVLIGFRIVYSLR